MSSALLRREDRDAILVATSGIVSSLETMLKTLKAVDGQPKETVKAKLSPLSKQAAGTISQLLDSMEAARSAQAKELSALEAKAKQVRAYGMGKAPQEGSRRRYCVKSKCWSYTSPKSSLYGLHIGLLLVHVCGEMGCWGRIMLIGHVTCRRSLFKNRSCSKPPGRLRALPRTWRPCSGRAQPWASTSVCNILPLCALYKCNYTHGNTCSHPRTYDITHFTVETTPRSFDIPCNMCGRVFVGRYVAVTDGLCVHVQEHGRVGSGGDGVRCAAGQGGHRVSESYFKGTGHRRLGGPEVHGVLFRWDLVRRWATLPL